PPEDRLSPEINVGGQADYLAASGGKQSYTQNWQLGIQRELPWAMALEASYVGNKGTRLPSGLENLNQVPSSYLSLGPLLQQDISSPDAIAAGIGLPY